MNKIFLGGTCGTSTWRDQLMKELRVPFFNPVVSDWTPECQAVEEVEKDVHCNIHFYCITKEMQGVFSIAEVVDSAYKQNKRTILHVMPDGFEAFQIKSFKAVINLVNERGGIAYMSDELDKSTRILNECFA